MNKIGNKRTKILCIGIIMLLIMLPMGVYATENESTEEVTPVEAVSGETTEETTEEATEAATEDSTEEVTEEEIGASVEETTEEITDEPTEEAVTMSETVTTTEAVATTASWKAAQTDCILDHDHETEICEIPYYGTLLDWTTIPYSWDMYGYSSIPTAGLASGWEMANNQGYHYKNSSDEYDIDIRHKIAAYSDGEYLYVDIIHATVYDTGARGTTLIFIVDGVTTQFQLVTESGTTFEQIDTAGTYTVYLNHDLGALAGSQVEGSEAYLYVRPTLKNSEFEFKIPITALAEQNPDVDIDNINEIEFRTDSLTDNGIIITGISTYPLVLGAICIAGVGFIVYKRTKKKANVGVSSYEHI